ncbi:MAG: HEPN domain-containing protein [Armatimonadota bacterium]|nr:HEPN domain-containing protein [Armatimonadota bacterium]MDR7540423.1 HEPN domain-containing protein [Armatimonadota bacterium]
MPHDPELVAETRGWLVRARADLAVHPPLTGDVVFHAQQAAEKAMKGFLTWHSRLFRKTHNLTEPGELCARLDPTLEPLLRRASGLTDYAWKFRYPGEPDEPPREEAEEALALAGEVYEQLLVRLPREVAP